MNPAEEFRKQAAECTRMAASVRDATEKSVWRKMAERWLACAALSENQYAMAEEAKTGARRQRQAA